MCMPRTACLNLKQTNMILRNALFYLYLVTELSLGHRMKLIDEFQCPQISYTKLKQWITRMFYLYWYFPLTISQEP